MDKKMKVFGVATAVAMMVMMLVVIITMNVKMQRQAEFSLRGDEIVARAIDKQTQPTQIYPKNGKLSMHRIHARSNEYEKLSNLKRVEIYDTYVMVIHNNDSISVLPFEDISWYVITFD